MESSLTKPPFSTAAVPMMTIKASELLKISDDFATELVRRLDRFNADHPEPIIDRIEPIDLSGTRQVIGPKPQDLHGAFVISFCRCVASRYIITPAG
jgi:hypothetical protein